jgi:SAM-dependent methyltransferase
VGEAAERWRRLVEGRLGEMERLQAGRGGIGGPQYWNRRARMFATGPMSSAEGDPMLRRLQRAVGAAKRGRTRGTVLDVGSGPGRFSLAIAPRAAQVVAVDPSSKMLAILRRRAREAGVANVRTVVGSWQDVDVEPADVVLCSHVLPLIADVEPFLRKLDAAARHTVLLYIGAFAADAILDPFWRRFHDTPRRPGATWLDAVAVIEELGIRPEVEVVELEGRARYETMEEAVAAYGDALVVPKTAATRKELRRLLEPWLQHRNGALYPPFRTQPAAIVTWRGGTVS